MGMYASTVIVTGAGRCLRRALTSEPSSRGAAVQAAFGHGSTGAREWVARFGGGAP